MDNQHWCREQFCNFTCEKQGAAIKHYRLKHGSNTRTPPLPCLHRECPCIFKCVAAVKVHPSRGPCQIDDHPLDVKKNVFQCQICDFKEPCAYKELFSLLRAQIRMHQGSNLETRSYTSFIPWTRWIVDSDWLKAQGCQFIFEIQIHLGLFK